MLANRVRMSLLDVGVKPEDIADENCQVATDADFSGDANENFRYIGTATSLVIPHIIKGVRVTSYASMFSGSIITEVRSNNPRVTNMNSMFRDCSSLTSLDVSNFDTSRVSTMSHMFRNCSSLTSLDVSNFDTSNVTDMGYMFGNCSSLTSLDVNNFNTSRVSNMSDMFGNCSSLTSLDLSNFDTSRVNVMNYMFSNCGNLTSLNLSNFNTSMVYGMNNMFRGCSSLTSLDLSNFNTSRISSMMINTFQYCTSITTAYARTQEDVDKFNSSSNKPAGLTFIVKPEE